MKRVRKTVVAILTIAIIISNLAGNMIIAKATTYSANTATGINFVTSVGDIIGIPGETVHVKLPIKAIGGYILNPKISVNTENMPFTVSNTTFTAEGYTSANPPVGIPIDITTYIEFDLNVKETALISRNKMLVSVKFIAINDEGVPGELTLNLPNIYLVINSEREPAQLTVDNIVFDNAVIGSKTELSFDVKNEGEITSYNTAFNVAGYKDAGITPGYSKTKQPVGKDGKLAPGESYRVTLPVNISSSATAGNKTLTVNMTYKDVDGVSFGTATAPSSSDIYINIENNSTAPKIEIESTKYASELKAGDEFNLVTTLINTGISTASEIEVSLDKLGTESFLPNYTTKSIVAGSLKHNKKIDVKIPLIVSADALVGLKAIPVTINYKDAKGVACTPLTTTIYLEIVSRDGVDSTGKPNLVVSNVSQSPDQPNAGGRVDISFDLENKSNIDVSDMKISITNLTSANFNPLNSEPYQFIDKVVGGKKARITIPLTISEAILEGMSNLELKIVYKGAKGLEQTDTATIYVLDVQNASGAASKPKLIISNFTTDLEKLKAGSSFNFVFDIKNTHSNTDAKNIKVTVSQADNIFSVTQGSNSFYISEIPAGETVQNKLELKVKSDAVTKAYPVEIKIEYDYDGAKANPTTGEVGETIKETINLQAVENSRPVVNNIFVGSYGLPTVNQPTGLTFEFYNMGKSPLNNVSVTVEGDYTLTTGNMYFIGNVESGSSQYAELEVIPNLEGLAKGNLIITFEDSNGEEVKLTKEFEAQVQSDIIPVFDDGMGGDPGAIVNPAKASILPIWLFIIIQVIILGVAIPVTRKTILGLYRKKLRKQEEAE